MSRITRNIFYNIIGQGLVLVLGFVAVKYVFKQLGEEVLGIIYFTLAMNSALCAVMDMGICSTTVREVAKYYHDEKEYIFDFIRTASFLYWSAYLFFVVIIYFGSPLLAVHWLKLETLNTSTATHIMQTLGMAALLALPQRFYASLFRGLQRMEFNNIIDLAVVGLQQIGIIVILSFEGGILSVIYWFSMCFGFGVIAYLVVCSSFFTWRAMVPKISTSVIKRNSRYSLNITYISLLSLIHMQADKVILSRFLSIGTLGFYGFAYGITSRASALADAISQAVFPSFSEKLKGRNRADIMMQYRKYHDLVCLGTVPLFAAIFFLSMPLFTYIFNDETAKILLLPVLLLCTGFYMHGALMMPYFFSLASGNPEISAKSNFLALFIVLPVTVVLIYFFGLVGAAFSWVVYHLFAYAYTVRRICTECLRIMPKEWYEHFIRIFVIACSIYGVSWTILQFYGKDSLLSFLTAYLIGSTIYGLSAYLMMGKELKVTVKNLAQTIWMRAVEAA